MIIQTANNIKKASWLLLGAGFLAFTLTILSSANPASAAEIDRTRCKVDVGVDVDALGNPINHVQITVKVDTLDPVTPIGITVTNEFGETSHDYWLPIDGTATGEWDSSPDGAGNNVVVIDAGFADVGENIIASIDEAGAATMTARCRSKAPRMFRQDTKPVKACKPKKRARGRC